MSDGKVVIDTKLNDSGLKSGLSQAEKSVKSSGIGKAFSGIGKAASTGLNIAKKAIGIASTGVTAFGGYSVKAGMSFEEGMSKVKAISQADAKSIEQLTEKAKEMGAKTKFSATESSEAFQYMAMAGWDTKDMLSGIESVMNLAAASGEDLATTSDIVTDAITAFGHAASDTTGLVDEYGNKINYADHFADVLAQTAANANTNVGLMGETFKYIAPVAGALGYSIEDTSVAIGLMANQGIKASQAGTSLRSLLTNLAKPSDTVQAAMERLGISLTDASGNMKPLNQLMVEMRGSFVNLTEEEKANAAASLAGKTGMSGLLAIMNASDVDFKKLTKSINNCNGATKDMSDTMQDNLAGQITILKSATEGLGIALYDTFKNKAKKFVKSGAEIVSYITDGIKYGNKAQVTNGIDQLMSLIIKAIAIGAPKIINAGVDLIGSLCTGILRNESAILNAIAVITRNIAGKFASSADSVASGITEMLVTAIDFVTENAPDMVNFAVGLIGKMAEAIMANAPRLIDAVQNLFVTVFNSIGDAVPVLKPVTDIFAYLAEHLQQIAGVITPLLTAWAAYQAVMSVVTIATNIATAAQSALNVAMMANPVGLVIAGIAGLAAVLGVAYLEVTKTDDFMQELNKTYDEAYRKTRQLSDAEQQTIDSISNLKQSYDNLNSSMQNNGSNIEAEYRNTETLWAELQKITTENGKIKKGYEDRAKTIAGELSEALGVEVDIVNNQIKGYKDLQKEIDNTILKKKLEALISSDESAYTDAVKNQADAYGKLGDATDKAEAHKKKLESAEEKLTEATKAAAEAEDKLKEAREKGYVEGEKYGVTIDDLEKRAKNLAKAEADAQGAVDGLKDAQKELDKAVDDAQSTVDGYNTTIANYDKATAAVAKGSTKAMNSALKSLTSNFATSKTASIKTLKEQVADTEKQFENIKKAYEAGGQGVSKAQIKSAKEAREKAKQELAKAEEQVRASEEKKKNAVLSSAGAWKTAGKNAGEGYIQGLKSAPITQEVKAFIEKGINTAKKAQDSHSPSKKFKELGKWAVEGYANGIDAGNPLVKATMMEMVEQAEEAAERAKDKYEKLVDAYNSSIEKVNEKTKEITKLEKQASKQSSKERAKTNKEIEKLEKERTKITEKAEKQRTKIKKAELSYQKKVDKAYYTDSVKELLEYYDEINKMPSLLETVKATAEELNKKYDTIQSDHESALDRIQNGQKSVLTELYSNYKSNLEATEKLWDDKLSELESNYKSKLSEIESAQETFSNNVLNFAGLFDEVKEEEVIDADSIIANAAAQTAKVEKYYENIEKIKNMDLPEEIKEQFKDMGVNSADQLEVFVNMSAEQIKTFVNQWKKRNDLSQKLSNEWYDGEKKALTDKYEMERAEAEKNKKAALDDLKKEYEDRKATATKYFTSLFNSEMNQYNSAMNALNSQVNKQARIIAQSIKDGLIEGSAMTADEASRIASNLTDGILEAVKENLDIHSPSRVFAKIGDLCLQGFEQPFEKYNPADVMKPSINSVMNTVNRQGMTSTVASIDKSTTNSPTLNFYDTQTSPDAIYRKFNQTMRYGLAGGLA